MIFTLMNKNAPVCKAEYNKETHNFDRIVKAYIPAAAPPLALDLDGKVTERTLNRWWHGRAIPNGRTGLAAIMDTLQLWDTRELLEEQMGLSLSDRYWLDDGKHSWDDVNFFDNPFPDGANSLGTLTLQPIGAECDPDSMDLFDPNASLGGCMKKCWRMGKGKERLLYKNSVMTSGLDALGEAVATALHTEVMRPGTYVPYTVKFDETGIYSICGNMLKENEELVTAYDLAADRKIEETFDGIARIFEGTGIPGVREFLNKMFLCDFLIGNYDRHYNNFGVIRNVETLEYVRMAPVYDSGNALWQLYGPHVVPNNSAEFFLKPFACCNARSAAAVLEELPDLSALPSDLSRFYDVANQILSTPFISDKHRTRLLATIRHQEEIIRNM